MSRIIHVQRQTFDGPSKQEVITKTYAYEDRQGIFSDEPISALNLEHDLTILLLRAQHSGLVVTVENVGIPEEGMGAYDTSVTIRPDYRAVRAKMDAGTQAPAVSHGATSEVFQIAARQVREELQPAVEIMKKQSSSCVPSIEPNPLPVSTEHLDLPSPRREPTPFYRTNESIGSVMVPLMKDE